MIYTDFRRVIMYLVNNNSLVLPFGVMPMKNFTGKLDRIRWSEYDWNPPIAYYPTKDGTASPKPTWETIYNRHKILWMEDHKPVCLAKLTKVGQDYIRKNVYGASDDLDEIYKRLKMARSTDTDVLNTLANQEAQMEIIKTRVNSIRTWINNTATFDTMCNISISEGILKEDWTPPT